MHMSLMENYCMFPLEQNIHEVTLKADFFIASPNLHLNRKNLILEFFYLVTYKNLYSIKSKCTQGKYIDLIHVLKPQHSRLFCCVLFLI